MPGFNQQQLNNQARNANTVTIMVGDQIIAFAQTTSHTFGYGAEQLYGIGSMKPQEVQQLRAAPSITLDYFALTAIGEQLLQGNQNFAYILSNNQFNIHVIDGTTNNVMFTYVGCVASNYSENIATNAIITDAITFLALDVLDDNGNSLLQGNSVFSIASSAAAAAAGVASSLGANIPAA